MNSLPETGSPCLACGACCAHFRVSFYWAECDDATPGGVPAALTEDLPPHRRAMKGTDQQHPRCVALTGEIGTRVRCDIYPRRASACRGFLPSYSNGQHNDLCDKARAAHGLPPLRPDDWRQQNEDPDRDGPRDFDTGLRPAA